MFDEGPLHGVRVLDLTRLFPGPLATGMLADMGADVLKVEETSLVRAGMTRDILSGRDTESDARMRAFNPLARGKRSIAVDARTEAGAAVVRRLAEQADVLIEAYRPGVLDRWKLGYEDISAVNDRIVYCSINGFGDGGPYRDRPGHDYNYSAVGGAMSITSDADGRPVGTGIPYIDHTSGYFAVIGILAALRDRDRTGLGQRVQVPMVAAAMQLTTGYMTRYFRDGWVPRRGKETLNIIETADNRFIVTNNGEAHFWRTFCETIGHPEFESIREARYSEQVPVYEQIRAIIKSKTRDEWMAIFGDKEVCVTPVLEFDEVPLDPQVRHLGMVRELTHERYGTVRQMGFPIYFDRTPWSFRGFAPGLGQDNEAVLAESGYSPDEIQELYDSGVIVKIED